MRLFCKFKIRYVFAADLLQNQTGSVFVDSTIRQTLHMSIGAKKIRIRLSNVFGITNLPITAVTVALTFNNSAGVSAIQPETLQHVTFDSNPSFTIPNGALAVSDPVDFTVKPQSNIAVTIYLANGQQTNSITSHPGSRTTSYFTSGNAVNATNFTSPTTQSAAHWYFLSAVEAFVPASSGAFAIVGDSITDGRGSDPNENNRWPDLLLARLQKSSSTSKIAIVNQAAGGNRVLLDGLGPNALGRIDRDVLAQSGIKYAMLFEGVNDIGGASPDASTQQIIGDSLINAFKQIIVRVHTSGIPIFGATITPFSAPGYNVTTQPYSDAQREKTRLRVNAWLRSTAGKGGFDAVVDFDAVLRNETHPEQLQIAYQGGDFLHPNGVGYSLMAKEFPMDLFKTFAGGVSTFQ